LTIQIVNPDALNGPGRAALADVVLQVADNFDAEYMHPDDPFIHGRSFTVIEASAELVLRLTRDQAGVESITILDVIYAHTGADDDDYG
jgi:hypothetical protein